MTYRAIALGWGSSGEAGELGPTVPKYNVIALAGNFDLASVEKHGSRGGGIDGKAACSRRVNRGNSSIRGCRSRTAA